MKSQDVILGILMETSASGYEIKQHFERLFSNFYNASYGTIYPTLTKLEQDGLITKQSLVQEGRPNKNVYTITEKGREAFHRYMVSDIQEVEIKSDFMLRLFFAKYADPTLVIAWLESGIRKSEETISRLQKEREQWAGQLTPTQLLVINMGIANQEAIRSNLLLGLEEWKK